MRQIMDGLWQGDIGDLNALRANKQGFTLMLNVGSTPFVPRAVPSVYLPLQDITDIDDPTRPLNDWERVTDALLMVLGEVGRGGKVLVVCDAGISRSVVFCAMAVSILEGIPMMVDAPISSPLGPVSWIGPVRPELPRGRIAGINHELMEMLRTPGELEPSYALWKDASHALRPLLDEMDRLKQ